MAIDTVKLRSPSIDEGTASFLERQCVLKQGIDCASGEVLYEITSGSLEGSWDSRISFKVHRDDWVSVNGKIQQMPCAPFVMIEGSIHKFFYGQNIYGNPVGFQERCRMFINMMGELLGGEKYREATFDGGMGFFHAAEKWQVRRVDWAEMFRLSKSAIGEFFQGLEKCRFPRRKAKRAIYDSAVHFPGKFTTVRIYAKGPEFRAHEYPRMRRALTAKLMKESGECRKTGVRVVWDHTANQYIDRQIKALQRLADNRLRAEVQINSDKLHHDFDGRYPLVSEITDDYLIKIFEHEMFKLLREGKSEMETVRTCNEVFARLESVYGSRKAKSLHSFWVTLAGQGEDVVRARYSKTQFYANRTSLIDAGISWLSSDVFIVPQDTALPRDFRPLLADPRRCTRGVSNSSIFNFCPVESFDQRKAA